MNERIKELEKQAYDFVNSIVLPDSYNDTACSWHRRVAFNEKFAELIVKECANFVQFYYKDHACEVIAHDMKQHFGVEE